MTHLEPQYVTDEARQRALELLHAAAKFAVGGLPRYGRVTVALPVLDGRPQRPETEIKVSHKPE